MRQHNLRILFFLLVLWGVAVACSRREARFRIGVSQCSEDEWRRQMNSEILREAHFYEDVEVDIRTAVDDNDRQAKDIRELIAEGVDLLIVAPNEATPITPVVEEAYNRGIPVIVTNINNVPIIWLFFYLPKYNLRERAAQFIDKQQ